VPLDPAFKKLRKNYRSGWQVLIDLRASSDPAALLAQWRAAEEGSAESRFALFYERAVNFLVADMDVPRKEAEREARRYTAGRR